jgi:hypothetical protein
MGRQRGIVRFSESNPESDADGFGGVTPRDATIGMSHGNVLGRYPWLG